MIAGLIAFFQALPQLVSLVTRVGAWIKKQENQKWLADLEDTITKVEKAQNVQEKQAAAADLVRTIRSLR